MRKLELRAAAWEDLLLAATSRIDMLGYALYFLTEQHPDLRVVEPEAFQPLPVPDDRGQPPRRFQTETDW